MNISKDVESLAIEEIKTLEFLEYDFISHGSIIVENHNISKSFNRMSGGGKEFIETKALGLAEQHFSYEILSHYRVSIKSLFDFKFKVVLKPKI